MQMHYDKLIFCKMTLRFSCSLRKLHSDEYYPPDTESPSHEAVWPPCPVTGLTASCCYSRRCCREIPGKYSEQPRRAHALIWAHRGEFPARAWADRQLAAPSRNTVIPTEIQQGTQILTHTLIRILFKAILKKVPSC